jgi:hypothetical protein
MDSRLVAFASADLKPHRVAAALHLPPPLLITSVRCIELTIAVPAWSDTDKEAAHRPLLIHVNELLVQACNVWECSGKIRRAAEERVQAALLEPDPLGSTAAMFAFARDVNDRTKLVVDKLQVQIYVGGVPRVEMVLTDLNARTTDALGQDVRNSATCVDYSPDNLVQTRFKAMSFLLSVVVNPADSDVAGKAGAQATRLVNKVSVAVRITRFYHRKELEDSWKRHMQLVDVNFGAVKIELGIADFMEVYPVASTLCNWFWNSSSSVNCALFAPIDGMAADREPLGSGASGNDQEDIELQITYRGTIEAKLKFTSAKEGPQEFVFVADRAAGNVIFHRHGVRELQMSLHELAVRFRGYVVFRLKPDREVFHVVQRRNSLSVKWRVQSVFCRIDDDLAVVLKEMYHFVNEKEQVLVVRCGTCHQQISLDMIDVHVCPPRKGSKSVPMRPQAGHAAPLESRRSSFSEASSAESSSLDNDEASRKPLRVNGPAKVHVELHMDELELQTGSTLVRFLIKVLGISEFEEVAGRDVTTKLSNLRLTTESNEFAGDAIFVPALPLAFQMLECALQGCRCYLRRKDLLNAQAFDQGFNQDYRWPARLFLDIAHCAISAQDCFVELHRVQMRSSFSDGSQVCLSSQPQLSFHVSMDKLRCRLDRALFSLARHVAEHVGGSTSSNKESLLKTLFLGVLQIRAVEFTLQDSPSAAAHAKSLLKQAIVVFDNQLGFLCTQSSLDFKTLLNLSTMKFVHRQMPAIRFNTESRTFPSGTQLVVADDSPFENCTQATDVDSNVLPELDDCADEFVAEKNDVSPSDRISQSAPGASANEDESAAVVNNLAVPPDLEREDACRCIQRMVRRKQIVRQKKQRFQADDYEPGVVKPIQSTAKIATTAPDIGGSHDSLPVASHPTLSLGIPSPIMIFGTDNDFVGEIRGGINKLMSPLSRTRLHSDSIRGGINKLMGPINRSLSPISKRRPSVESVAPIVQVACYNVTTSETRTSEPESSPPWKSQEQCHDESKRSDDQENARCVDAEGGNAYAESASVDGSPSKRSCGIEDASLPSDDAAAAKLNELSEAKLAALPEVVRVLIQVGECRLCVPINPREKIEYLCREVVRRFNESFAADRGSISAVSLQDKHGGVFSPSDTVGFMLSVAPTELLFAHPHNHDGQIRSLARLAAGPSRTGRSRPLQDLDESSVDPLDDNELRTRCSKLPLPLALALLANESERDLIRLGLCDRESGEPEAWPDLALNAASLDAEKNLLMVEVAWHETCIEVTNGDAFALCRQLLGLCTSRVTCKYVGKIMRGRLKVEPSNPLVEWAVRRGKVVDAEAPGDSAVQPADQELASVSYEELKKAVQATFGVYAR